jgi:hypothetical protein
MGSYDPFGHLKHKLWLKERLGVKLTVWLLTIKSQESTWFLPDQAACDIPLESSWQGLQLCFKPHRYQKFALKLWAPKVVRILAVGILGLPLGSPRTKCHLDVAPVERHKEYYKGEGGGFPQVRAMVNLVSPKFPMVRPNTKSAQTMH